MVASGVSRCPRLIPTGDRRRRLTYDCVFPLIVTDGGAGDFGRS
jgi:hypothetical protein